MTDLDLKCQICSECGTPKEHVIKFLDHYKKVPVACKCDITEYRAMNEKAEHVDRMRKLDLLRKYSLMDAAFSQCTFENWKIDDTNKVWYKLGKKYCEEWQLMKRDNIGMMLHGATGTGKTYLSFCIANELLKQGVPVIATSSINVINKVYESYSSYGDEGEVGIINQFKNASLVVLDDLGAEHEGKTGKEKQIIYSLIDTRIRLQLPIIITTNLKPEQLKNKLTGADGIARTYDRIIEACPQIEMTGKAYRVEKAKEKLNIIRSLVRG